jgi:pyruvate/2-oxoglutarate dehydrogenase complex dihydrolipoamide acyltransferase (E2) component
MGCITLDPERLESLEAGHSALLEAWLVSEGDRVHAGQVVARVQLRQQTVDVQAPHGGRLEQILVPAGERFAPSHVLAHMVDF